MKFPTLLLAALATFSPAAEKPNIVIILADDMGFSDLSCYGSEIPTPNIDALAAEGVSFTRFYNTGRCCPSRASLLTGLYSHQAGVGMMTGDFGVSSYQGYLNEKCVTIADVANSAGYFTAVTGKWHVGSGKENRLPLAHGFDRFYGTPEGGGFYHKLKKGRTIMLNDETVMTHETPHPEGWYVSDAFTSHALDFVDEAKAAEKPFLLYVAHIAPHFPLQADPEDLALFEGKYDAGWDAVSEARYARQKELGMVDPTWGKVPRTEDVPAWDSLSAEEKKRSAAIMRTYAAVMHRMDKAVGDLVSGLKERGEYENTLILFMSDNGGSGEGGILGRNEGDPTQAGSSWWAGTAWAWASNTPFRRYKQYADEGGISTPLIARWPAGLGTEKRLVNGVGHFIDLMPTVLELTGATYPEEVDGKKILPLEGRSLLPLLKGETPARPPLFWEHDGNAAVREGDLKLVRVGGNGAWQLYDLATDRAEQNNLADSQPEKAKELKILWLAWAERVGAATDGKPGKIK